MSEADLVEKLQILQLETLYDLALELHDHRPEEELVEGLLQRLATALDPAAAVAVTRDAYGGSRAVASFGWRGQAPAGMDLLQEPLWRELLAAGQPLARTDGSLAGRGYRHLLATPLAYRDVYLGYLALLDKEARGGPASAFTQSDRRFLDSVAALGAVALHSARRLDDLAVQRERLAEENKVLKGRLAEEFSGQRIVAHAPAMRQVIERIERVAPRGVNVLLRGESGTGKELMAKLLHFLSGRTGALIAINCAALPETLLESELFGIERGVATGVEARRGKFALADGGTLFLDEIGDLEPALQVKLLRVLQEREVVPVGGERPIPVDVRVIAATHRKLPDLVEVGDFREDLYYRLKGVEVDLPPIRERRQDIPHLVRLFTEEFCEREGLDAPHYEPAALALLLEYDYPGNVRELQNLVAGALSLADETVTADLLRGLLSGGGDGEQPLSLAAVEHLHIVRVMRMTGGNKSAAARVLGLDRRTLQRKGF